MSNLPRRPSARVFWNSAKLWPGETPAKRRPQKTPWCECHHVLIKISLKCHPSTTFCCKPRLPKCPWSRAMSNFPRRPLARVFWNSAKLRPGETPVKRRPQKTPWSECDHVLITISLKCQSSTTFCCKPRLPKCPWSRAMSNLPRRPSARVFWNSAKLLPGETPKKRRPQKTPWRECHHVLIKILLKCQPSTTFCLQTAPPKVPVKPTYVKFAKETLSGRFLKFCKVATRENSSKKKATKNNLARMPLSPNYHFVKVPS